MLKSNHNVRRFALVVAALATTFSPVAAQSPKPPSTPSSIAAEKALPDETDGQSGNSIADEMRIKRQIKFAEKEHQENLDRAKDASDLGQDLAASFKKKSSLDREDLKKLDKLEKLAKRIRGEAGGGDDDISIDKKPVNLAEAVDCVAEVSATLNDKVQGTPRQVISAIIIDKANVLLQLIRIVRGFSR